MKTINEFVASYVDHNGSARVLINGDYVDIDVEGATQVVDLPADIYVVNNAGIDGDILNGVGTILVTSDVPLGLKSNTFPSNVMNSTLFKKTALSPNLFAYELDGLPSEPEPEPEPVVNTTIPPDSLGSENYDDGVPFSVTGGEEEDTDEDEDVDPESQMVW